MARSQETVGSVEQILEAACARQSQAELHFDRGDGERIVARVRLLLFGDDQLLADRPTYADSGPTIPVGRPLKLHVAIRGRRYEFDTVIESEFRQSPGHAPWTGPGIQLRRPASVRRSQRRASVRVSLAAYDPIPVIAASPCPSGAAACTIEGPLYQGWMADVSAGGLSIVLDGESAGRFSTGDRLFLTFRLPEVEEEFFMLGSMRHAREGATGESVRVAFAFRDWSGGRLRLDQQRLARFVARQERTILKRRR